MTNNQLTDERIEKIAVWLATESHSLNLEMLTCLRELQERRKADMNSEPYGFTDGDRRGMIYKPEHADRLNEPLPVYRHAQPAPVITFYRDGIEAAAKWIDQQREAYDSENGRHDPDTGSFEFGSEIKREYSSTLEELAEGIRALHPNAGNSPVIPEGYVKVPKEPTKEMIDAGWLHFMGTKNPSSKGTYKAMLAAAPQEVQGE
ncbi:hypothetical protein [Raoultella ornithinolytica]|uniref:hypothetical protein n=1 Tax=Raoultella ornithinolytica TaxID=54291 RepID=UPI002350B49A|nr:hypothetical protein [Raoultella ornithinolytica]MDC7941346.1 hypothetical protein [Raoultella ornithinolytica]